VNSRQEITDRKYIPSKFIPSPWSRFKDIRPPFPPYKKTDNLIITFDVNFTTQVLTRFRKSKRFEDTHNLINQLHEEGMGNKKNQIDSIPINSKYQQERITQDNSLECISINLEG